ncbi:hypothetical protein ALC56_00993, partial [Trachymyrmex septentrionalis]
QRKEEEEEEEGEKKEEDLVARDLDPTFSKVCARGTKGEGKERVSKESPAASNSKCEGYLAAKSEG